MYCIYVLSLSISLYVYIGGLGELVRLVRPPVTGRSASFRLRFRFVRVVRAVRAGEAKLRGVGLGGVALG